MRKVLFLLFVALFAAQDLLALTIEDGQYYTISSNAVEGCYAKDTGEDIIRVGGYDDASIWQFIATSKEGCFYIKNKKTGRYAQWCNDGIKDVSVGNDPVEYRVKECAENYGAGVFGLTTTNLANTEFTDGCYGWNVRNDNNGQPYCVQSFAAKAGTNDRSFWKIERVIQISSEKVYVMSARNDNSLYIQDNGGDNLAMGNLNNASLWQFENAGEGKYYVKNVLTGRYAQACPTEKEIPVTMGEEPVAYVVVDCSDKEERKDCFGLTSADHGNTEFTADCIGWNWRDDNVVQSYPATAGTNHRSFWKFTELEPQSITASGYATFCATEDVIVLGAQAYKGAVQSTHVALTELSDVPAGSAVVLKGSLYATIATTAKSDMEGNDLKASNGITADGRQYVLANANDVVGFYKVISGESIAAGKAYIEVEAASDVKCFTFGSDDATSVEGIQGPEVTADAIYNIAGQRLNRMQKGINIVGGKKILK